MGEAGTLPWKLLGAGRFEASRLEPGFNVVSDEPSSHSSWSTQEKEACLQTGLLQRQVPTSETPGAGPGP